MNVSVVVLDIVMIVLAPIVTVLLIGALSRRLLGVRVGVIQQ